MKMITGECLCCGVVVTVTYGCPARPEPYTTGTDSFGGGPRARVVLGIVPGAQRGGAHEVPLAWPAGVPRLTDKVPVIEEVS